MKYDGFKNTDTADKEGVLSGMLGFDCSYKKGDATNGKIGNYDITPKGLAAGNYVITFVKGTLTVKEKAPTATEEGIMTYTCTTCGNVITQPIVKIASATGTSGSRKNTNSQNNSDTETKPYIKDDSGKEGWNVISSQLDEAKSIPVDVINNVTGTCSATMNRPVNWNLSVPDRLMRMEMRNLNLPMHPITRSLLMRL